MQRFKFSLLNEDAERGGGFHFVEIDAVFKIIVFTYGLPVSSQVSSLRKLKAVLCDSPIAAKATSTSGCEVEGWQMADVGC